MIKDDLVYNWQTSESHVGFKIIAVLVVTIIFTIGFTFVDIDMKPPKAPSLESATVLHFADDDLGRAWMLVAEEGGPFPGRLEINGAGRLLDMDQMITSGGVSGWSSYDATLREFQSTVGTSSGLLAQKGQRYFPGRVKILDGNVDGNVKGVSDPVRSTRKPILTPFDDQALGWMPEQVPDFEIPVNGGDLLSASWRFMLRLRPDGSVSDCVSLSGGGDAGLKETTEWLKGLRFKSGGGERWLGLRVEFLN